MSTLVSGLIGAVVAFALVTIAERNQKSAQRNFSGWKVLRPGWLTNATLVGCTAFATLWAYFLLRGGSTRPDAGTQNIYALLLLIAAVAAVAYIGWTTYGRTIMWKGNELRVRTALGREVVHLFSDVSSVTKSEMRGEYRLTFRGGSTLWLSAHLHGAKELVEKMSKTFRS